MPSVHERHPLRDTVAHRRILASAETCFSAPASRKQVISCLPDRWNEEFLVELSDATEASATAGSRSMST